MCILIKDSQISKQTTQYKMDKDLEETVHQRRYIDGKLAHVKMSNSSGHDANAH